MQVENSVPAKSELKTQITEYVLMLHDVCDGTKETYRCCLNGFTNYLLRRGTNRFEDVTKREFMYTLSAYIS